MTIDGPGGAAYWFGRVGGVRLGRCRSFEPAEELFLAAPERECSLAFVASGRDDQMFGVLVLRAANGPTTPLAYLLTTSEVGRASVLEAFGALLSELGPVNVDHAIGAMFGLDPEAIGDVPAEHTLQPWPAWGGARVEWDDTLEEEWELYRILGEQLPVLWCTRQFAAWVEDRS
ncbi:MAG: hypothetical protein KC621_17530 [Myxococcales bacterium]|nr:hypothetical protein [Myxococcales bacterium]